jgi:hypothetical protein
VLHRASLAPPTTSLNSASTFQRQRCRCVNVNGSRPLYKARTVAHGPLASSWEWPLRLDAELGVVQHGNAEFAGLVELRAGAFAGHHIVGVLAHGTGHVAGPGADEGRDFDAGKRRQRGCEVVRWLFAAFVLAEIDAFRPEPRVDHPASA